MATEKRPRKQQSTGTCVFCGKQMTKGGISKHLATCPKRAEAIEKANAQSGKTQPLYHLLVKDAWGGDYWLHLEMNGKAALKDLDHYLRAIWLECCGHLSQFSIGGWGGGELPMERHIERVFKEGIELTHIYDFGTESVTLVKFVAVREGQPLTKHPIYLMSRNNPLEVKCMKCDQPAQWLCVECIYEHDESGLLCDTHVKHHNHTDYGDPMPLFNSPRVGLCGYDGPAIPPY